MDITSIMGISLGIAFVIFGITSDQGGFALLGNFIHIPSMLITIGGSLSGVLAATKLSGFLDGWKSIRIYFQNDKADMKKHIENIISLSETARKEGLLVLEELADQQEDELMKKGLLLLVDGTDPELIRRILEVYLDNIEERYDRVIAFWEKWSGLAPAWGMIGTLIGLVNMLKCMGSDADSIGPNMATALITTFYGSIIANWICIPVASKLRERRDEEVSCKELMVEGILSIQAGENPRLIQEKLIAFLPQKLGEQQTTSKNRGSAEIKIEDSEFNPISERKVNLRVVGK